MKKFLLVVVAIALGIQLIRPERTNPVVESDMNAPPDVVAVLRQSCYDCHSHETIWPWYAGVAPVSWLIAHDVNEGREHVNFSTWNTLARDDREHTMREMWEEISTDHMPLWYYLRMHADARLTDEDRRTLRAWIKPER